MPFSTCTTQRRQLLTDAYNTFIEFELLRNQIPLLRRLIQQRWQTWTIKCGTYCTGDCEGRSGGCLDGLTSPASNRVLICRFERSRVGAILLHELVHACGGSELDAEAIEHACFSALGGSSAPFGRDWGKFCGTSTRPFNGDSNTRVGDFVIWDSRTGEVWVRTTVSGQVAKGERLFRSNQFIPPSGRCRR